MISYFISSWIYEYFTQDVYCCEITRENRISSPQDLIDGTALFSESWV